MLGFLRHGDGALALFHGAIEEDRATIAETLALAQPARAERGGPKVGPRIIAPSPDAAPFGGYERMVADKTLALFDCGPPPPDPFAACGHAGTLAFELSVGRDRMVVNCGHRAGEHWRTASRATAAHSTVVVGDVPLASPDQRWKLQPVSAVALMDTVAP